MKFSLLFALMLGNGSVRETFTITVSGASSISHAVELAFPHMPEGMRINGSLVMAVRS